MWHVCVLILPHVSLLSWGLIYLLRIEIVSYSLSLSIVHEVIRSIIILVNLFIMELNILYEISRDGCIPGMTLLGILCVVD